MRKSKVGKYVRAQTALNHIALELEAAKKREEAGHKLETNMCVCLLCKLSLHVEGT